MINKEEFLSHYSNTPVRFPHKIIIMAWPQDPLEMSVVDHADLTEHLEHVFSDVVSLLKEFKPQVTVRIDQAGSRSFVEIHPSKSMLSGADMLQ